jgi:hypothetical protein
MVLQNQTASKSSKRDLSQNDHTVDHDYNQSTILLDRTNNDMMLTVKEKLKPVCKELDDVGDQLESNIGQTFENRHTLICYDNHVSCTSNLTSQINHTSYGMLYPDFSQPKVRQWNKKINNQKGTKINLDNDLNSIKSGINISLTHTVEDEESKYESSQNHSLYESSYKQSLYESSHKQSLYHTNVNFIVNSSRSFMIHLTLANNCQSNSINLIKLF